MKKDKPHILSVRIEHVFDESPDTSYLGEYRKDISPGEYTLDRMAGVMKDGEEIVADKVWANYERHDYRYLSGFQHYGQAGWEHVSNAEVSKAFLNCRYRLNRAHENKRGNLFEKYKVVGWQTAVTRAEKINCLNIVYCCEDAYRMETLQRGDWSYIGIIAKAEIKLSENSPIQTLRSGGLWGVESDAGKEHHKDITEEQLRELENELEAIGFSARAIKRAFQQAETISS